MGLSIGGHDISPSSIGAGLVGGALAGVTGVASLALPFLGGDPFTAPESNAYPDAVSAAQARQQRLRAQLAKIRSAYGVSSTAEDVGVPEDSSALKQVNQDAARSKSQMADLAGHAATTEQDSGTLAAQDQFSADQLAGRRMAAAHGLTGGSVDSQSLRDNLSKFVAGRQTAVAQGLQASSGLKNMWNSQRQSAERTIQAGYDTPWDQIKPNLQADLAKAGGYNNSAFTGDLLNAAGTGIRSMGGSVGRSRAAAGGVPTTGVSSGGYDDGTI